MDGPVVHREAEVIVAAAATPRIREPKVLRESFRVMKIDHRHSRHPPSRGDFWFPWEKFQSNSVECDAKEDEDLVEKIHVLECYSVRENRAPRFEVEVRKRRVCDDVRIMRSWHTGSDANMR